MEEEEGGPSDRVDGEGGRDRWFLLPLFFLVGRGEGLSVAMTASAASAALPLMGGGGKHRLGMKRSPNETDREEEAVGRNEAGG